MAVAIWARKIHHEVNSQPLFERLYKWMEKCESHHRNCREGDNVVLPTRIIDVGSDGTDPFLFVSKGRVGRWATLSYCWGDNTPLKPEVANIVERCERIGFEEMPVLFQDAIVITRRLGYQYLWIDALCIVQDSHSDWTVESANMGYSSFVGFLFLISDGFKGNKDLDILGFS
jgi:hypothetical protein